MLWESNNCVELVEEVWRRSFSKNKAVLKISLNMPERKSPLKKKNSQIKLLITYNWNYSPRLPVRFPHPEKYSWGISYEYLSGLPEPTKLMSYYLRKCLKLIYRKQENYFDTCFLRLMFLLRGLFLFLLQ